MALVVISGALGIALETLAAERGNVGHEEHHRRMQVVMREADKVCAG
jgi:hypothetical protein